MAKTHRQKLIEKLDNEVRKQVLERDGRRCQRCTWEWNPEVHHVIKRANKALRWDANNLITLCKWRCHPWYEANSGLGDMWFIENWPERWTAIQALRNHTQRWRDSDLAEKLTQLLEKG